MRARNALGQLSEQRVNDLLELLGLDDVQNLLHLAKEHHLKVMCEYSLSPFIRTSLELQVLGQNLSNASKTCGVRVESFSMNWTTQ
jgi:hypothetical protein